ncbi:OrfX [Candidatus Syntrophocurvum alkaliphilum]|uniref:OrfX n=1 Tax=Candidatus Syntrophocurvum alkaliphilum TaxID=2293317 RepID=A0A6I6DDE6_9FIRM|nr:extracellular matrix/biofilm biosynthesis regulator RemA family protein [Candidatus Syntrophocurvum alkaliphilum]QGU00605.1 OrfX [Candidatus Syntrophocurvum alkaliphilum]
MYIHLGNDYVISAKGIIAILNIEPPVSEDVLDIIEIARDKKNIINISSNNKEKALVICDDKIYMSPISSFTLCKRVFKYDKEGVDFGQI